LGKQVAFLSNPWKSSENSLVSSGKARMKAAIVTHFQQSKMGQNGAP
jgi:hypothetical protein